MRFTRRDINHLSGAYYRRFIPNLYLSPPLEKEVNLRVLQAVEISFSALLYTRYGEAVSKINVVLYRIQQFLQQGVVAGDDLVGIADISYEHRKTLSLYRERSPGQNITSADFE